MQELSARSSASLCSSGAAVDVLGAEGRRETVTMPAAQCPEVTVTLSSKERSVCGEE